MQAIWNDKVIADSDDTVYIEGNQYFPKDSVKIDMLEGSDLETVCHWKGTANYYNIKGGPKNAAWYYADPLPGSVDKVKHEFKDYIAFYPREVTVK